MKEFKFTGTLHPERIQPYDRFRKEYQNLRGALMVSTGNSYPEVEVIIRVHDRRQEWIDKWYTKAKEDEKNGEIFIKFCKDVTVVCVYATNSLQEIACAAPRHGDKYDQHTGVAVAYAKLCSAQIPDYI
jgi:hypothetical protein